MVGLPSALNRLRVDRGSPQTSYSRRTISFLSVLSRVADSWYHSVKETLKPSGSSEQPKLDDPRVLKQQIDNLSEALLKAEEQLKAMTARLESRPVFEGANDGFDPGEIWPGSQNAIYFLRHLREYRQNNPGVRERDLRNWMQEHGVIRRKTQNNYLVAIENYREEKKK